MKGNFENKNNKTRIIVVAFFVLIIVIIAVLACKTYLFKSDEPQPKPQPKQTVSQDNPQLAEDYNGVYDESSGLVKGIDFFNGEDKIINDCVFSKLRFASSPNMSSLYSDFTSNNDKITGNVTIKFTLYDKNKNVVKEINHKLKNIKKGQTETIYIQYSENIENVDSLEISFN